MVDKGKKTVHPTPSLKEQTIEYIFQKNFSSFNFVF